MFNRLCNEMAKYMESEYSINNIYEILACQKVFFS